LWRISIWTDHPCLKFRKHLAKWANPPPEESQIYKKICFWKNNQFFWKMYVPINFLTLHKILKMVAQDLKGSLGTTIDNKIATVEFGHPSWHFRQLMNSLTEEINVLSGNKEVSVIVLWSLERGFCAGASLRSFWSVQSWKDNLFWFCQFD
jgi:hypothetical protein